MTVDNGKLKVDSGQWTVGSYGLSLKVDVVKIEFLYYKTSIPDRITIAISLFIQSGNRGFLLIRFFYSTETINYQLSTVN